MQQLRKVEEGVARQGKRAQAATPRSQRRWPAPAAELEPHRQLLDELEDLRNRLHDAELALTNLNRGLVELDPNDQPVHMSETVAEAFHGAFETSDDQLPEPIRDWLEEGDTSEPLITVTSTARIVVQHLCQGSRGQTLLVESAPSQEDPQRLRSLGLTEREAETLHWVAQGKTNGEVASILEIGARTVAKHLEAVYVKLGVESRTAATLRALEVRA